VGQTGRKRAGIGKKPELSACNETAPAFLLLCRLVSPNTQDDNTHENAARHCHDDDLPVREQGRLRFQTRNTDIEGRTPVHVYANQAHT